MTKKQVLPDEILKHVSDVFRVLGDRSRLEILQLLMAGPQNVSEVVKQSGKGQANVSKHLTVLAHAHLVARTQRGNQAIYEISDPLVHQLCELVCGSIHVKLSNQVKSHQKLIKRTRRPRGHQPGHVVRPHH